MNTPFSSRAKGQKCRPHTLQILKSMVFLRLPPMTIGVPTFHKIFWWITCNKLLKLLKNHTSEIHIAAKSHVVAATASLDDCTTCAGLWVFWPATCSSPCCFFCCPHCWVILGQRPCESCDCDIGLTASKKVSKTYGKMHSESMSQWCQWFW